jgi:hypothetical protein
MRSTQCRDLRQISSSFPLDRPHVGIDKAAVVRDALTRYKKVAFAGDRPPGTEPALLVAPSLRCAHRFLAQALDTRGEPSHFNRRPKIFEEDSNPRRCFMDWSLWWKARPNEPSAITSDARSSTFSSVDSGRIDEREGRSVWASVQQS